MEPNRSTAFNKDDDDISSLMATPYLLFYSDVLKELSSTTKDPVDIAKEAKERWSKMTPRSLEPYVEAASLMKSSVPVKIAKEKVKKIDNRIEPEDKLLSLRNTKSSHEIFKLKKRSKSLDSKLLNKGKKLQMAGPKRIIQNVNKITNKGNKMAHGVSQNKALKYKTKNVRTKCCRKKYCCSKKKPKKKKISRCKKPCPCKKIKGDCPCHHKKDLTENVINRQLQDYLRYKSKRKRKLKQGIEDLI